MTELISLLVPTRGRPDGVAEMWRTAYNTASHPNDIELILYLDDDDSTRDEVMGDPATGKLPSLTGAVTYVVGPRIVLTDAWNKCYEQAKGSILMHCADDIRFRTIRWDDEVRSAFQIFNDRIALVYGRDGVHDQALGTHSFLHRKWVETVGYFLPPYFSSDYGDTWINDVAGMVGRRHFIASIYTEHMHPVVGKGPLDKTHQERLARGVRDGVDQLYTTLLDQRLADAEKLRGVMHHG